MKTTTTLLVLMIFLTTLFTRGQGFSPRAQNHLQTVIDSFQNKSAIPFIGGISAAIKVDGLALWQGVTGYAARNIDAQNNLLAGGTPFTAATLSRIYSVTKTFTAALVLELAKEGAFGLDNQVSMYLPLNLINPALNGSVTIRQLLAHESGYSDYTDEMNLQIAVAFQPTHIWTPFEMLTFVHQVSQPGAVRRYSSTNYIILGAIIEAVTGKPAEKHYRERFFEPLGLSSMYLDVRESKWPGSVLASPHDNISPFNPIFQFTGQPTFPDAYTNISALPFTAIGSLEFTGGGIISNAADLAEWGNALFGGRATSKTTLETMLSSVSSTPDEFGNRLGYGIKNTPFISGSFDFIGHNGSAPGYRSVMFYNAERKMTIVVLTNFAGVSPYDIASALYEVLPGFTCGNENKKEEKIQVCFQGKNLCIDRLAVPGFIEKGAHLGECDETLPTSQSKPAVNVQSKLQEQTTITASPNPFTNGVTLSFKVPQSGPVNLRVYDLNGKLVASLFNSIAEKGVIQKVSFDGSKLPAGIYISRMQTAGGFTDQKLVKSR